MKSILINLAYLSTKNSHLNQIIRFSEYEIERELKSKFKKICNDDLESFIKKRLEIII